MRGIAWMGLILSSLGIIARMIGTFTGEKASDRAASFTVVLIQGMYFYFYFMYLFR